MRCLHGDWVLLLPLLLCGLAILGIVSWLKLEYLDGEWRGRMTSIESKVVYLVVDRLAGFNFSAKDAHLAVDD